MATTAQVGAAAHPTTRPVGKSPIDEGWDATAPDYGFRLPHPVALPDDGLPLAAGANRYAVYLLGGRLCSEERR